MVHRIISKPQIYIEATIGIATVTTQFFAMLVSASLIGAGALSAAETRSFDALPVLGAAGAAGADKLCRVDVLRSGAPGSAAVTRFERDDRCVCTVTTGPEATNGTAENIVRALLRDRTCDGAPPPLRDAAAAGSSVGIGFLPVALGIAVAAGGLAVVGGNDSNG